MVVDMTVLTSFTERSGALEYGNWRFMIAQCFFYAIESWMKQGNGPKRQEYTTRHKKQWQMELFGSLQEIPPEFMIRTGKKNGRNQTMKSHSINGDVW